MEQSPLELARQAIDQIDGQLCGLFKRRMEEAAKIASYKAENGLAILDQEREAAVLARNLNRLDADDPLRPYYADFLQYNMALSRQYQARRLGRDTIAYQGIPGAFSHIALTRLFPHGQALALPTFAAVFQAVINGEAAYGVLPFENSQAGDVSEVLDLCLRTPDCYIHRMYDLAVNQNLLALPGTDLGQIRRVVSHPQALAQCAAFLRQLNLSSEVRPNTAMAAQMVAEGGDPTLAAIASAETAALYGLQILCPDISETSDNATRFIVIAREAPQEGNRFCLLFTVRHEAGRLARAMETIARLGYNMECIKSKPRKGMAWEYYFYAELVGEPTPALLSELGAHCDSVRLLGRYERSAGHGT